MSRLGKELPKEYSDEFLNDDKQYMCWFYDCYWIVLFLDMVLVLRGMNL